MNPIRVQKILADAGYGSRRGCEKMVAAGRVTVNGKVAVLGERANPDKDEIRVDGQTISTNEGKIYILLNKPKGYLASRKSQGGKPTVLELVRIPERIYPVGRLDLNSEGLILLTNDGSLTNLITHPRYGVEKEYHVRLRTSPNRVQLNKWREGVVLDDGVRTQPAQVEALEKTGPGNHLKVIIREGKKRHIRRTARALGLDVVELKRVRIGKLQLVGLEPGDWRELSNAEVRTLIGTAQDSSGKRRD
ncbi:MAG: rRNA pseudouridine synthase [Anaerolineales bacterium]|nr:rRNA pseudouridine synthase [Anaerolineales bacterium]